MESGVDVCLKCFNGACVSKEFNHSLLHYNMTKHPITLNIKQILKVRLKCITKLLD